MYVPTGFLKGGGTSPGIGLGCLPRCNISIKSTGLDADCEPVDPLFILIVFAAGEIGAKYESVSPGIDTFGSAMSSNNVLIKR